MNLYHGGMSIITQPRIVVPADDHTNDFGNGFYTTTDYEQAKRWVGIRKKRGSTGPGHVCVYKVRDDLLDDTSYEKLIFNGPSQEWLDFVLKNRDNTGYTHNYDIVSGPVANDRVYAVLSLFESAFIDVDAAIRQLKTYTLVDQILFHTERVLQELHFVRSDEI
jgi:hypothetical protein